MDDLASIVAVVRDLAAKQGRLAVSRWSAAAPAAQKDARDFATEVDLEIENNVKAELRARFPGHGLAGEETRDENRRSEHQWLIDPIDGTKYYAGRSSLFSVSIGLLRRGEPILGVVYNAPAAQSFYAFEDGGAYLDGQRLYGSSVERLSDVIANVETPKSDELSQPERDWFEKKLLMLERRLYRVRVLGQSSLAACWLAGGALDAYLDLTGYVQPYDVAAARVIMKESGATVGYLDPGVGPRRLLAAPPKVFAELRRLLLE